MACSGWFQNAQNVRSLRQAVHSGKRGGLGKNVNKDSSKTKIGVSQDNVGKADKKGSEEKGISQCKGAPLAVKASTKTTQTSVGHGDENKGRRPFEFDPLTGRSVYRLEDSKTIKNQEKLEQELALAQQILRDETNERKRQQIFLMAELLELTGVPSAKQLRAAWEPGKSQVKSFDEVKGRRAQGRCRTRGGLQIRVGSAGGNGDKTNELEGVDG